MAITTEQLKNHLALALDTDSLDHALELAESCKEVFGVIKVGLELYSAYGPEVIHRLTDRGFQVFVDLKLYDIPTTVGKASSVLSKYGCTYLTVHAAAGRAALTAAVEGAARGGRESGNAPAKILAVTVLTSEVAAEEDLISRMDVSSDTGCDGVICAANDIHFLKERHPNMLAVVPGIRPAGSKHHDQVRIATPSEALSKGADLLVIGRAVTESSDPHKAAIAIIADIGKI